MNLLSKVGASALVALSSVSAMAAPADPAIQAFADLTTKVTAYGGYSFALAVVGTAIWVGIGMFQKGARKGAK